MNKSQQILKEVINLTHSSNNEYVSFQRSFCDVQGMNLISTVSDDVSLITDDMEIQENIEYEIIEELKNSLDIHTVTIQGKHVLYTNDDLIGVIDTNEMTAKSKSIDYTVMQSYEKDIKLVIENICKKYNKPLIMRLSMTERGYTDENEVMFSVPPINIPSNIMYPWLDVTPEQLALDFMKSNANILLLYGEPGTGKTTFVKKMLTTVGFNKHQKITVVDSSGVMESPEMVNYIFESANNDIIVLEDIDRHLYSREDGNQIMSGLLNASAGLASSNVKLIITTNIVRLEDIDSALIRPGRCYRTIQFRKLQKNEQLAFGEYIGQDVILHDESTLAEVMNPGVNNAPKNKFGFNG